MTDCIFCKIAAGEIPAVKLYDDGEVLAFRDINPEAPVHALIVPRRHIATLNDLEAADAALVGQLYLAGKRVAADLGAVSYTHLDVYKRQELVETVEKFLMFLTENSSIDLYGRSKL